jgi:ubiquinone/menaquinone biosynthesis C-methylase UbiE
MFAPVTRALVQDAGIEAGRSVLDVATGPGEPALSIAEIVGSEGKVVGIDPVTAMIAAAERAARRNQFMNVRFEVSSVDHLPFPEDSFDAAVSRFGVMFFSSPVNGVREMLRVLKRNRKIAFAVWYLPERNPFHYVWARVLDRYVQPEPVPPNAPDAFRFAEPGKLLNILKEAGASESIERLLQFNIEVPLSTDELWTMRSEMSDKLRTKLAGVSKEQLDAIRRAVITDLSSYTNNRGISLPAEVLIVSGTKL